MEKDARREASDGFFPKDFLSLLFSLSSVSLSIIDSHSTSSPVRLLVVDEGSVRPGEKREMRLMKRVRFVGVLRAFLALGGVLGFKRSVRLGSAADGVRDAVVAMDQRD